jgi:SAM-dependent methyltransferase
VTLSAARQEKYHDPNPVVGLLIRRFFDRIGRAMNQIGPASVLDAGCGEGEALRRGVFAPGTRVVSLDLRWESLAAARAQPFPGAPVCGSVLALPFGDGSFDAALCLEVLEHLDHPAEAVRELARVARRAVVFSVPHEPYFRLGNVLRGKHLRAFGNHPEHVQHWNFRTFRSFLTPLVREAELMEAFPWIVARCRPR